MNKVLVARSLERFISVGVVAVAGLAVGGCGEKAGGGAASGSAATSVATAKPSGGAGPESKATAASSGRAEGGGEEAIHDVPADEKSAAAKFCLGADGTSQDCAISCKVDRDRETCAKWEEKTRALCPKIGKQKCQEICEKDENPVACDIVKTMK